MGLLIGLAMMLVLPNSSGSVGQALRQTSVDPKLITTWEGQLPLVITAPHGGKLVLTVGAPRTGKDAEGKPIAQFATVLDTNTDQLALQFAKEVEILTGKRPWLVIANFSRKFVDANRPVAQGAENEEQASVHALFHEKIAFAVQEAKKMSPSAMLLDIHGQGADKASIFRGTQHRKSVRRMISEEGSSMFFSPKSFLGQMDSLGLKVVPSREKPDEKEDPRFNGGYIVQTYGSHQDKGIDAIQLEFGGNYRSTKTVADTAKKLAKSWFNWYSTHQK